MSKASNTTPLLQKDGAPASPKSFWAWLCGCCLALSPEAVTAAEAGVKVGAQVADKAIEASNQPPAAKVVEELLVGAGSSLVVAAIKAADTALQAAAKKDGVKADPTAQAAAQAILSNDALKHLAEGSDVGGQIFDAAAEAASHESVAALGQNAHSSVPS